MSLELCMIVKDSGDKIFDTLKSWLSVINHWTILDTGSSDNTPANIRKTLADIPGTLYEEPNSNFYFDCFGDTDTYNKIIKSCGKPAFDFAKARNRALELCSRKCDFIVIIDDTYQLYGAENLKKKLSHLTGHANSHAFCIDIRSYNIDGTPNNVAPSLRFIRSNKLEYKWEYPIHEILNIADDATITLTSNNDVYIKDVVDNYHVQRSLTRFHKDIIVLEKCFQRTTDVDLKARYAYHAIQTAVILKNDDVIRMWLKNRIDTCSKPHCDLYHTLYSYSKYTDDMSYAQQAIEMFPNKVEAYYELALILCKKRLQYNAFLYLKHGHEQCLTGGNEMIRYHAYNQSMRKLLITLSLQYGDGNTACSAIHYMLHTYNCFDDPEIKKNIEICKELNVWKEFNPTTIESRKNTIEVKVNISGQKTVVFITGPAITGPWDGNTGNVRGSETSIIKLAESLVNKYNVIVYCETPSMDDSVIRKVRYVHCSKFLSYIKENLVDYVVCVRNIEIFTMLADYVATVRNYYFWCHDAGIQSSTVKINQQSMRYFIFLTKFHKELIQKNMPIPDINCVILPNGIDINIIKPDEFPKKVPNRFIYSSDANRGLYDLITLFPMIRKLLPGATLHIYCDLQKTDLECFAKEQQDMGKKNLQVIRDAVRTHSYYVHHGRTDKTTLYKGFAEAEYWFYPTGFTETFCITALEAQYFKCKIITSKLGALQETVKSGILYNIGSTYQDILKHFVSPPDWKLEEGHKWALEHSYDQITKKWIKMFRESI